MLQDHPRLPLLLQSCVESQEKRHRMRLPKWTPEVKWQLCLQILIHTESCDCDSALLYKTLPCAWSASS